VLLRLGCDVVGVEPDDAMRARIHGAETVAATAEELPLADGSFDAVVAGQEFHEAVGGRAGGARARARGDDRAIAVRRLVR
jgi:hypothetical protein